MRLWKCDRCGQVIEEEDMVCVIENARRHDTQPDVDLCPGCFASLQRFILGQSTGGTP